MFPIKDENRPSSRPYVNYGLILLNCVFFFFFYLQGWNALENSIVQLGAIPWYILRGERLWTLFTSMFMHADTMHILGNMLYLWVFGDNIEDFLGHKKYIGFYMVGGLAANFTHILSMLFLTVINPAPGFIPYIIYDLRIPAVGASGAVSSVLGAYLFLFPKAKIKTLVFYIIITIVSVPALYYLGFWFIYQLLMGIVSLTGLSSGVAFWAHIGGFVFGFIVMRVFGAKRQSRPYKFERKRTFQSGTIPWARTPLVDIMVQPNKVMVLAMLP